VQILRDRDSPGGHRDPVRRRPPFFVARVGELPQRAWLLIPQLGEHPAKLIPHRHGHDATPVLPLPALAKLLRNRIEGQHRYVK
jgi:hypothetical protein